MAASKEEFPKSRRAGIAAAARILQRDLGLSPGNAHRRARQQAAQAETEGKTGVAKESVSAAAAAAAATPQSPTTPHTAHHAPRRRRRSSRPRRHLHADRRPRKVLPAPPATTRERLWPKGASRPLRHRQRSFRKRRDETPSTTAAATSSSFGPCPYRPQGCAGEGGCSGRGSRKEGSCCVVGGALRRARRGGFVKHANPSQGVTEPLLKGGHGGLWRRHVCRDRPTQGLRLRRLCRA